MSATILPLNTVDSKGIKKWAKSKQKEAEAYAKMAEKLASIPGVPDIKQMIKDKIEEEVDEFKKEAKAYIIAEATRIMMEILSKINPPEEIIEEINKVIEEINKIVDGINTVIDFLKTIIGLIFPVIIVLTVAYVVAKVITMIPSFGGGIGAVVVASFPGNVAGTVQSTCEVLLKDLKPIPSAIIGFVLSLLSMWDIIANLFNMIIGFLNNQLALLYASQAAADKSAEDWKDTGSEENTEDALKDFNANDASGRGQVLNEGDMNDVLADNILERISIQEQINNIDSQINGIGISPSNMGDCTLPDGTVQQMTPEDCESAGGIFGYGSPPTNPPSPPSSPYTDASGNVWCWEEPPGEWVCCGGNCFDNLVECTLPSGEVLMMTPTECTEAGGTFPGAGDYMNNINNLLLLKSGLEDELNRQGGKLSSAELNNLPQDLLDQVSQIASLVGGDIITTLLNPDPDVTVEEATKNFGERYGFYQQKINEDE